MSFHLILVIVMSIGVCAFSSSLSFYLLLKFLFHLFLIPAMVPEDSMNNPLCHSAIGSMVTFDHCTPDTSQNWCGLKVVGLKVVIVMSSGHTGKGVNKSVDAKLHTIFKTFCVLSQQSKCGNQRRCLHDLDDQARGARVQKKTEEHLRASSELAARKDKGHDFGPQGKAAFTRLLHALSERCSTEGAANAAGVANQANVGRSATGGAFDLVLHCKLAKVCDPTLNRLDSSQAWHNIESTFVGHSDKQGRSVFSVRLHAELWNGRCRKRSNRIEKS